MLNRLNRLPRIGPKNLLNLCSLLITFSTILYILSPFTNYALAAQIEPAEFTLDPNTVKIEADCTRRIMLIKWTNSAEPYVTGFKVHSRATDPKTGETVNQWLNKIAIVAKGPNKEYTIISTAFEPNIRYLFRLYGFEKNKFLSKAKNHPLSENFAVHCIRLPVTIAP